MSEHRARSTLQRELCANPPFIYRTCGLHMSRLVQPGSIVRTNYSTGPYVVVSMHRTFWRDGGNARTYEFWSFRCDHMAQRDRQSWPKGEYYLNQYVAVGRRILGFMNDDEIFVEGFDGEAARRLAPKSTARQMDLFAQ